MKPGLFSAIGAVFGAVLSSACCWLPLLLIGMGASTLGVAGFFEVYRPYFLIVTAVFLGGGFYYAYLRKPKCAPGGKCIVPNPRIERLNKVSLWTATALVLAFALFPNYIGAGFGSDGEGTAVKAQSAHDTSRIYAIDGMTCEACTGHVRSEVAVLMNVKAVEVSYSKATATVVFEGDRADDLAVLNAVAKAGYIAHAPPKSAGR